MVEEAVRGSGAPGRQVVGSNVDVMPESNAGSVRPDHAGPTSLGVLRSSTSAQKQTPSLGWGFGVEDPGDDLLSHAAAHYHRRGCVSLPSSGWDRVVPQRYVHQGEGGGSRSGWL